MLGIANRFPNLFDLIFSQLGIFLVAGILLLVALKLRE